MEVKKVNQDGRWSPESNAARSRALKGKPKPFVTRARMHASRLMNKRLDPVIWERLYKAKLQELKAREEVLKLLKTVV